ncbi:N-acetylglutamate kinase [Thermosporothrix hazakensis]|jgi:acetylglutamate kinase|uniref:Acetylglutamate kinase n=2 Tax=Thermosporothrix TaxID=768650 RepID=A0A326UPD8_THEHA|nr:acetylglutamate kinase [Thermosporothrix hazakensis]PZW32062.1 N-acetylglutamate kinase [Thermosporothrix hazakensis]BBH91465.1 acetylglutamate kinase [Thermosporothrix sp. COM3]GCE49610.1 acetylglutamate kinase [Thermosporothrix hazakensis]
MAITYSLDAEGNIISDQHLIAQVLSEAISYINFLKGKILVIKLGGSMLEHQQEVLQDVVWLHQLGAHPVLVHGGGPYINEWLTRLQIPTRFINGLRVTDEQTLEVVRMVLSGQINQRLVLMTAQLGGNAVGLTGTDGGMLRAHIADERLGYVGEIDEVDPAPIQAMIEQGFIPIIAPLAQGAGASCLNINADLAAAHIAGALNAEKLIFLSNVVGICGADGTLISELSEAEARKLIEEGIISGGMIPKVSACLDALAAVPRVHIVDGREQHVLLRELFTNQGAGTMIIR